MNGASVANRMLIPVIDRIAFVHLCIELVLQIASASKIAPMAPPASENKSSMDASRGPGICSASLTTPSPIAMVQATMALRVWVQSVKTIVPTNRLNAITANTTICKEL